MTTPRPAMTPERRKEIEARLKAYGHSSEAAELFAEIDRLEKELASHIVIDEDKLDAEVEAALDAKQQEIDRLKGQLLCDVCGGSGTPANCGCGGTGSIWELASYARVELHRAQLEIERQEELKDAARGVAVDIARFGFCYAHYESAKRLAVLFREADDVTHG